MAWQAELADLSPARLARLNIALEGHMLALKKHADPLNFKGEISLQQHYAVGLAHVPLTLRGLAAQYWPNWK